MEDDEVIMLVEDDDDETGPGRAVPTTASIPIPLWEGLAGDCRWEPIVGLVLAYLRTPHGPSARDVASFLSAHAPTIRRTTGRVVGRSTARSTLARGEASGWWQSVDTTGTFLLCERGVRAILGLGVDISAAIAATDCAAIALSSPISLAGSHASTLPSSSPLARLGVQRLRRAMACVAGGPRPPPPSFLSPGAVGSMASLVSRLSTPRPLQDLKKEKSPSSSSPSSSSSPQSSSTRPVFESRLRIPVGELDGSAEVIECGMDALAETEEAYVEGKASALDLVSAALSLPSLLNDHLVHQHNGLSQVWIQQDKHG